MSEEIRGNNRKYIFRLWFLLPMSVLLLFIIDISLGSVYIPFDQIISILLGGEPERITWGNIVWQFRLPKAITAVLAGSALAVSGLKMQTFFRNPLAGPFVLGISSGASLGVALLILTSSALGGFLAAISLNNWIIVIAASAGASLVLILVVFVSVRIKDSMTILIIGLMFGSATGAIVSILQFFSNAQEIQAYLLWTFGSLGGLNWNELRVFAIIFFAGLLITVFLIKPLNAYLLGENYAESMGLSLKHSRIAIIIAASLLAGVTTAFCGPIAFIGIAVPHLVRLIINSSDHRLLVPAVCFGGALVLLICDIFSQFPGSQNVLPINAVTSLVGAPVVIWVIMRRRNISRSFAG